MFNEYFDQSVKGGNIFSYYHKKELSRNSIECFEFENIQLWGDLYPFGKVLNICVFPR